MPRYPGAIYRPLAAKETQPAMKRHDVVCLHTMVGSLASTDAMFHEGGYTGTESHFGVGGIWGADAAKGYDGKVFQWQDTAFTADANYQGNPRVLSIETADNAPQLARDVRPWTAKQLEAIVQLVAWLCRTHSIPAVLIHDSKPTSRGIGYHALGVEHSLGIDKAPGFLITGGERWSTSVGKECPGAQRIAQVKTIIVPRVAALLKPAPAPPTKPIPKPVEATGVAKELDDWKVTLTSKAQVDAMNSNNPAVLFKIGDTLDLRRLLLWGGPRMERIWSTLQLLTAEQQKQATQLQRIEDAIGALTATMTTPTPTGAPRSV